MEPVIINRNGGDSSWNELFRNRNTSDIVIHGPSEGIYNQVEQMRLLGSDTLIKEPHRPRILITGTREPTPYGESCIMHILNALASNPLKPIIISGLGFGTDTFVHKSALNRGIANVAVLATGFDAIYPHMNRLLAEEIADTTDSCLLTQFPDGTMPEPLRFVERSRAMVKMADIVIIPEMRSGGNPSLVTRYAYSQGTKVYTVPGDVFSTRSEGCNELIQLGIAYPLSKFDALADPGTLKLASGLYVGEVKFPNEEDITTFMEQFLAENPSGDSRELAEWMYVRGLKDSRRLLWSFSDNLL